MKFLLIALFVIIGTSLFAAEVDSSAIDSDLVLAPVQSEKKFVDRNVQIRLEKPKKRRKGEYGTFIKRHPGPAPAEGGNYDSIHNINPKVAGFITVCFISFALYIIWRVRRSLKKDERNHRRNRR